MTYTHTQGIRNDYADFSYGILDVNKAAGLLTLLENGMPKLDGHSGPQRQDHRGCRWLGCCPQPRAKYRKVHEKVQVRLCTALAS